MTGPSGRERTPVTKQNYVSSATCSGGQLAVSMGLVRCMQV